MQKNHLTVIIILLLSLPLWGQKAVSLVGRVVDDQATPLMSATVVLLQPKDSVIAKFNITDENGYFFMTKIPVADYILQVSYIGYSGYSQIISVKDQKTKLPDIILTPVSASLEEVVINAEHIPIAINGDTLEYNAAAFQVKPNSAVEDLLKNLPGVEVARDGSIKAQGEQVSKVMVDGKEFFGDDPTIATKNLPADAVKKVQVFDKKSEMAEFSGIDDGLEQKTINLELKDGKKHGYFGNIKGGYGADDRYDGKFNLNRFGKNTQISAIGMANNINKQGFSFNDYINFMGGMGNFMSGGAMTIELEEGEASPLNINGQNGLTSIYAGGVNLNSDLSKKSELSLNYFFNNTQNILDRTTNRQSFVNDENFTSESTSHQTSNKNNHRLGLTLKHEIDSFQNLTFKLKTSISTANKEYASNAETFTEKAKTGTQETDQNDKDKLLLNSHLIYRRRFHKKGRLFTTEASFQTQSGNQNGIIFSSNEYSNHPLDSIHQRQLSDHQKNGWGAKIAYTEPLKKYKYIQFNASRQQYKNSLEKVFYDLSTNQESLNTELSNRYKMEYIYHQLGINFRYNRKKINFTSGISWQQALLEGSRLNARKFNYFLPEMSLKYDFKPTKNLSINYSASTEEPNIRQLQPIIDNSNPLNIYIGNPDLKPAYQHSINAYFMNYDQFNFTSLFVNATVNYTKDKISYNQNIDSLLVTSMHPVNVDNDLFLEGSVSFSTPIRPIKSRINIETGGTYHQGILFINDLKNDIQTRSAFVDINFDNRKKDVIDLTIGAKFRWNHTAYLQNSPFNQQYQRQTYYTDLGINIGDNWHLNSSFDYQVYSNDFSPKEQGIPLWTASISKFIMMKKGEIKLSVFDILNKNIGIKRSSELNFTQEERIVSLGRYFMLSFAYSISGFDKQSGIQIHRAKQR